MFDKLRGEAKDPKNKKALFLVIGLVLIGMLITFLPIGQQPKKTKIKTAPVMAATRETMTYEETLERRLTNILQKMEGVGQVNVMLTTVSNEEKVLAEEKVDSNQRQEETDQAGGKRMTQKDESHNKVVLQSGNVPYVVKENKPVIKGVLVIAEGAGSSEVKENIIQSVSALLDVPVHKVSVYKKGEK